MATSWMASLCLKRAGRGATVALWGLLKVPGWLLCMNLALSQQDFSSFHILKQ